MIGVAGLFVIAHASTVRAASYEVFVSSFFSGDIHQFNPDTSALSPLPFGSVGGGIGAADIAFGGDGAGADGVSDLFVATDTNGEVRVINGVSGGPASPWASVGTGVRLRGLNFDPSDNNLYTGAFLDRDVYRIAPSTASSLFVGYPDNGGNVVVDAMPTGGVVYVGEGNVMHRYLTTNVTGVPDFPDTTISGTVVSRMTFGPDANNDSLQDLYITTGDSVVVYDVLSNPASPATQIGGAIITGLADPADLAFAPDGDLYLAEFTGGGGRLWRYELIAGNWVGTSVDVPSAVGVAIRVIPEPVGLAGLAAGALLLGRGRQRHGQR